MKDTFLAQKQSGKEHFLTRHTSDVMILSTTVNLFLDEPFHNPYYYRWFTKDSKIYNQCCSVLLCSIL